MKKAQSMIVGHDGKKKINEGDLAICIQGNKGSSIDHRQGSGEGIMVNMDWSFDKDNISSTDIKSFLGGFLANIEEVFGEKMVTEAIMHYAHEMGHIINTPQGPAMHLKSRGIDFKNWKK